MTTSAAALERARELRDLVNGHPEHVDAALPELTALLADADDAELIVGIVEALGLAWDERAALQLLPFAGYPDSGVREAVASALPGGVESEPVRMQVVEALVSLTRDAEPRVRDWACFGLGQLEADSVEVRDALAARLDDEDVDTRCEALVALAWTGDARALQAALGRLAAENPDDIWTLELQAVAELADPALLPALEPLAQLWSDDEDEHAELVGIALQRCAADAAELAADLETRLVATVNERLTGRSLAIRLDGTYPRTRVRLLGPDGSPAADDRPFPLWDFPEAPQTFNFEQAVGSWELTADTASSATGAPGR